MADERPDDRSGRERPESSGNSTPGGPVGRDEGSGRKNGRHRGFRGRHLGRPSGTEQSANGTQPGGRLSPREEPGQKPRGLRPEASRQDAARDTPACPLCGKPVYDLSTAISASREAGEPAHFDCVLERVVASESIAAGEKLVYLGSGSFGIVEFKDKGESAFSVKRRIQWEKEGEKKEWRKGISSRITNL